MMPTLSQPERFNTDAQGGSDHWILTMRLPNGCPNGCPNAPHTPWRVGVADHTWRGGTVTTKTQNNDKTLRLHMCNLTTTIFL